MGTVTTGTAGVTTVAGGDGEVLTRKRKRKRKRKKRLAEMPVLKRRNEGQIRADFTMHQKARKLAARRVMKACMTTSKVALKAQHHCHHGSKCISSSRSSSSMDSTLE